MDCDGQCEWWRRAGYDCICKNVIQQTDCGKIEHRPKHVTVKEIHTEGSWEIDDWVSCYYSNAKPRSRSAFQSCWIILLTYVELKCSLYEIVLYAVSSNIIPTYIWYHVSILGKRAGLPYLRNKWTRPWFNDEIYMRSQNMRNKPKWVCGNHKLFVHQTSFKGIIERDGCRMQ